MEPNAVVDSKAVVAHHGRVLDFLLKHVSQAASGDTADTANEMRAELDKVHSDAAKDHRDRESAKSDPSAKGPESHGGFGNPGGQPSGQPSGFDRGHGISGGGQSIPSGPGSANPDATVKKL